MSKNGYQVIVTDREPSVAKLSGSGFLFFKYHHNYFAFQVDDFSVDTFDRIRRRQDSLPEEVKAIGPQSFLLQAKIWAQKNKINLTKTVERHGSFEVIIWIKMGKLQVSLEVQSAAKLESNRKIKVLVVDDSTTIRNLLKNVFSSDPGLEVVGVAERPSEAEQMMKSLKPDVITLDINMPEMDGVTFLKKYMPINPIPTVVISSISKEEGPQVLEALANGAVDYFQKPSLKDLDEVATKMIEAVKVAAEAKVLRSVTVKKVKTEFQSSDLVIALGASTGGTEALRAVLESLPANIPPILIVQHIPAVFSKAFADRLNELCSFEVKEAEDGDLVRNNCVYVAPGGKQMGVHQRGYDLAIRITDEQPVNRHKPSVDYLFHDLTKLQHKRIVAGILTGMGADGARGLKALRECGARTIGQDEASSIVYGMPREAFAIGAVEVQVSLEKFAEKIVEFAQNVRPTSRKVS